MFLPHETGVAAFGTSSLPLRGPQAGEARQRLERDFERLALIPRLIILAVLGIGALLEYGHGHRSAHWVGLVVYGLTTVALGLWPERRRPGWLPWVATAIDAVLTVYVIAEHLPRRAADLDRATDAVSLMPAFLLLMQTGLRLRRDLVVLFAGLTLAGWLASIPLLIAPGELAAVAVRQTHSFLSFAAASGFVLYAVHGMQVAWSATLKAELDRLLLSRFLPRGVASDIVRSEGEIEVSNRHACLLILDLRGFSTLTRERPSGEVVADLMKFRALVHDAVSARGGVVDKYMGDGVLALFLEGTPEEQAGAGLQAVTDIFQEFEVWNASRAAAGRPPLRTIAALHRGIVLTGVFDDGRRAEFTVLGPAMNALARIERRAKEADADVLASKGFLRLLAEPVRARLRVERLPRREGDDELPDVCAVSLEPGPSPATTAATRGEDGRLQGQRHRRDRRRAPAHRPASDGENPSKGTAAVPLPAEPRGAVQISAPTGSAVQAKV